MYTNSILALIQWLPESRSCLLPSASNLHFAKFIRRIILESDQLIVWSRNTCPCAVFSALSSCCHVFLTWKISAICHNEISKRSRRTSNPFKPIGFFSFSSFPFFIRFPLGRKYSSSGRALEIRWRCESESAAHRPQIFTQIGAISSSKEINTSETWIYRLAFSSGRCGEVDSHRRHGLFFRPISFVFSLYGRHICTRLVFIFVVLLVFSDKMSSNYESSHSSSTTKKIANAIAELVSRRASPSIRRKTEADVINASRGRKVSAPGNLQHALVPVIDVVVATGALASVSNENIAATHRDSGMRNFPSLET